MMDDIDDIYEQIFQRYIEDGQDSDDELLYLDGDLANEVEIGGNESDSSEESVKLDEKSKNPAKKRKVQHYKWKKSSSFDGPIEQESNQVFHGQISLKSPLEYFSNYFSMVYFENAAFHTNQYSVSTTGRSLNTDAMEIRRFYGAVLLMGALKYPRLEFYWKTGLRCELLCSAFSYKRFKDIRRCLHHIDINTPPNLNNRLFKVQPIIDSVRARCLEIDRSRFKQYSVDEQMIPYLGRLPGIKCTVKNKPRPVGVKNMVIATSDTDQKGLIVDFEVYQGRTTTLPPHARGIGAQFVMRLVQTIPEGSEIYMDRFFTSVDLLSDLGDQKLCATGTIMKNRLVGAHFNKSNDRGKTEMLVRDDKKVVICSWRDSADVLIASNHLSINPEGVVKRYDSKHKKYITIKCPNIIKKYNQHMNGVDVSDQLMEYYRAFFKSRKWTVKIEYHFIDLSCVNSFKEYDIDFRSVKAPKSLKKSLLDFRIEVATALLRNIFPRTEDDDSLVRPQINLTPPTTSDRIPINHAIRLDNSGHFPIKDELPQAKRCRLKCGRRTRMRCVKCNLYLCIDGPENNCFFKFHTEREI